MNPDIIFTRNWFGFDKRVWLLMAAIVLSSIVLVAYRQGKNEEAIPCVPPAAYADNIRNTDEREYKTNEYILFSVAAPPDAEAVWDFGDSSKKQKGLTTRHTFRRSGPFTVTVTINGDCEATLKLRVRNADEIIIKDKDGNIIEDITSNDQVEAGLECKFSTSHEADAYKWIVVNKNIEPRYTKECAFRFMLAGTYTVKLILDNDPKRTYTKEIVVIKPVDISEPGGDIDLGTLIPDDNDNQENNDDPPPPPAVTGNDKEETVVPPVITKREPTEIIPVHFQIMLQDVVCGNKAYEDFAEYFCDNQPPKVIVTETRQRLSFQAFCEQIQPKKNGPQKITIKDVVPKSNNGCIETVEVSYKIERGIWLINEKNPCNN